MKRQSPAFFIALVALVVAAMPLRSLAQIPNGGFESWTSSTPDNWYTNDIPSSSFFPISQSATAHSGSSAMQGSVISFFSSDVPPLALSGTNGNGFPVAARYSSLDGFYRFAPSGRDRFAVYVLMKLAGNAIGAGVFEDSVAFASYTTFAVPITYINSSTPDTAIIEIAVTSAPDSSNVHVGTTFLLDDLTWGTATGVADHANRPAVFALNQNYPNPFNPSTTISYSVPSRSDVRLTVYDPLGRTVATLVDGLQEAGSHEVRWDAGGLASGIYYYRLTAGTAVRMKKLLLLK